ncbi:MAG TPA: hypothetical protein VK464_11160 [Symbiobacteriaceae bacterium]|nr:hypothetical protein [Symbiobacteriaceae bacterium]
MRKVMHWFILAAVLLLLLPSLGLAGAALHENLPEGDKDAIFGHDEQVELAGLIPGAELKVYPETGHAPHVELPAAFVADLEAFVDALAEK